MANRHERPPQVSDEKKQRLFYYEDDWDKWVPVPEETEKALLSEFFEWLENGDEIELLVRRQDMTDAEFDAIPEE